MEVPKTTQLPKSAEIIASIDDLLTELLLRLPIKSLIRFKIVSKHWQSLITNPDFYRRHHTRNPDPNPAVGLFLPRTDNNLLSEYEYLPFNNSTIPPVPFCGPNKFIKDPSGIRILQSCNGLLLCSSSRRKKIEYYVYNPTSNQFSTLPKLNGASSGTIMGMNLAFDPAKSPHYKVVCIRYYQVTDSADHLFKIKIYSSETGAWRSAGEPFTAQVDFEDGVYWNGAVHWVTNRDLDSLYFSIRDEEVKEMPGLQMMESEYYFGESCDHLHYIERGRWTVQFDVYEMKRDYSEWFVKYRVDLSLLVAANPRMVGPSDYDEDENYYDVSMYSLVRDDAKEENSFLVLRIPEKIIRYNLVSETFETLREYEGADDVSASRLPAMKGIQYIEPLCSV